MAKIVYGNPLRLDRAEIDKALDQLRVLRSLNGTSHVEGHADMATCLNEIEVSVKLLRHQMTIAASA